MVQRYRRLDINDKGEFTIEKRVVQPTPLGPTFLTFYQASIEGERGYGSVTSPFKRVSELLVLKPEDLPIHTPEMLYFSRRANAFTMSLESVREVDYQKINDCVWVKDWVAIQFYKISGSRA